MLKNSRANEGFGSRAFGGFLINCGSGSFTYLEVDAVISLVAGVL